MANEIKGIVRPPREMPPELLGQRSKRAIAKTHHDKTPVLVTIISWVLVIRTVGYLAVAYIVWTFPQSDFVQYLVANTSFFFKRPHSYLETPEEYAQGAREFLMMGSLLVGVLYGLVAWRWLTRFWLARWAAMFMAGGTLIKTLVNLAADRASGVNTQFSSAQVQALIVGSIINLAIFLYLAFYPGVAEEFRETSWK